MIPDTNPPAGTTYRTRDGRSRATYQPDLSGSLPWTIFINGSHVVSVESLGAARRRLPDLEHDDERDARLRSHDVDPRSGV